MERVMIHFQRRAVFYDGAGVHDINTLSVTRHNPQVVGDKN
jgi:hypothetical protein